MKWRSSSVSPGCLKAARRLSSLKGIESFYLAGGTALALRYGHRISVDLDFFSSSNALGFREREVLVGHLRKAGARIEEETDGTVHALLEGTHVSFFRYRYPLVRKTESWEKLRIAHPADIGLMKIGAVIGRGSRRDFIDLYYIARRDVPLRVLLRLARRKFSGSDDFTLQSLRALVYFEDAEKEPMPLLSESLRWEEIKQFFEAQVRRLAAAWQR